MNLSGIECDDVRRRVFEGPVLGNLTVPEQVDVRPLLLEGATRRLYEVALEPQDDDRVVLGDELARFEFLKFDRFPQQREELNDPLAPAASACKRNH